MVSPIQAINEIGKFSQKNMKFLNRLRNANIEFENIRKKKKNITTIESCSVIYDYDALEVKTKGKCQEIKEFL